MKFRRIHHVVAAIALTGSRLCLAAVESPAAADRTEAPRFEVAGGETNAEHFPLKSTEVRASIAGVIAEVSVEQTYANTGDGPIEATYVFPASTRAAVHGVEMRVGERLIRAKIQEKEQAKQTYEKAKSENKTASLLEQDRPNVFRMSVANILPGDVVKVTLHFSEKLASTDRVYEFVYPTVVGPRYSNKGKAAESWVGNPYLAEGIATPATFAAQVEVRAGMTLQALTCASHQPEIKFLDRQHATVTLPASSDAGNRDFVLRYRLGDQEVTSGLLVHEGEKEKFFLINLEPPARVRPEQIPARDYVFVLDVSGSMHGFPLDTAKTVMRDLLGGLRTTDTFNVLLFSGGNQLLSESALPATPENIARATDLVDKNTGGGGTELLPALKRALELPANEAASRSIVVVTDGYVDVEKEAFQLVRSNLGKANLFAFGIGSSVNRWLIEGLARSGQGEPFFVLEPAEAGKNAARFRDYISSPVLTDIRVKFEGFEATDVQPQQVADVFASRPIELTGKWHGQPTGKIVITGRSGTGPFKAEFDVAAEAAKGTRNPALEPLWAREKVRALSEELAADRHLAADPENSEAKRQITTLGLTYGLLTAFTSFVGVDETPREVREKLRTVQQPLPLPKGVSNLAVGENQVLVGVSGGGGGGTGSAPEPSAIALWLLTAAGLLLHRRRVAA